MGVAATAVAPNALYCTKQSDEEPVTKQARRVNDSMVRALRSSALADVSLSVGEAEPFTQKPLCPIRPS